MESLANRKGLELAVISPLHIGQGEVLSPVTDFVWQDGYLYLIDENFLFDLLFKQNLSDDFFNFVKNASVKGLKLKDFLEEKGVLESVIRKRKRKIKAPYEIRDSYHSFLSGKRWIPGSSIKGAIRTALAAYCKEMEDIKIKKYLSFQDKRKAFLPISKRMFGKDAKLNALRNLLVTDAFRKKPDFHVLPVKRFKVEKGFKETSIPSAIEVMMPNSTTYHEISLGGFPRLSQFYAPSLRFLGKEDFKKLRDIVNQFYKKIADLELKRWENVEKELADFYRDLLEMFGNLDENSFIIRIGSHKTFFDQTLAVLIRNELNEKDWAKYVRRVSPRTKIPKNFPNTEWVVISEEKRLLPAGWVKARIV